MKRGRGGENMWSGGEEEVGGRAERRGEEGVGRRGGEKRTEGRRGEEELRRRGR